jgi:hypothetical protein
VGDPLDDWLSARPARVHRRSKRLLTVVREAYPIGVPALILKSHTDRLAEAGGYAFHLGTPDDVLRRICSWLLTHGDEEVLKRLITDLWGRHGREDVALAALLLANLASVKDVWAMLADLIGGVEPAEALLLSIEELFRASRKPPSEKMLLNWCERGASHAHLALLCQHATWIRNDRGFLSQPLRDAIQNIPYPDGDSLLARVRDQMLAD